MPTEVQMAMGEIAAMRADRLAQQVAAMPPPTFTPSVADLVALPSSPDQAARDLLEKLAPQAASAQRQSAINIILGAAGQAPASTSKMSFGGVVTPLTPVEPWMPFSRRVSLPAVAKGGGGGQDKLNEKVDILSDILTKSGNPVSGTLSDIINDAWKSMAVAGAYPDFVRTGKYPWWWGPIKGGYAQVEAMLIRDLREYEKSRWLPDVTKALARENISRAMNINREQWTAWAARTPGAGSVAH